MQLKKLHVALIVLAVLAVAAGISAWYVLNSLDRRVAEIIEQEGSALTGTRVRVSAVSLRLKKGQGIIKGLRVENPEGFAAGSAIVFEDVGLTIDLATLRQNPIVIDELVLGSPRISLDVNSKAKSNLDELRRRVEKNSAGAPDPDPLRFRILKVTMPGGKISADLRATGGTVQELSLNTIRRSNVGGARGATSEEIAKLLVSAVAKESMKAATEAGLSSYLDKSLGSKAGSVKDKVKGIFK